LTLDYRPNVYVLGGKPKLRVTPVDEDGEFFVPTLVRLSVKAPDGEIITISGADLTQASGYLYYRYHPQEIGWYEYESWVRDGNGNEDTATRGFEIVDRLY